eukprot:gene2127-1993_t
MLLVLDNTILKNSMLLRSPRKKTQVRTISVIGSKDSGHDTVLMMLSGDVTKSQTFDPTKTTAFSKEMVSKDEKFEVFFEPITTDIEDSFDQIKLNKSNGFMFVFNKKSKNSFEEFEKYVQVVERAKDEEKFPALVISTIKNENKETEIDVNDIIESKFPNFSLCPEKMDDLDEEIQQKIETKEKPSYPILKELKDIRGDVRQQACMSISNMVFDDEHTLNELISCGAIHKVCQLLCDPDKTVRTSAAGALRNTIIAGDFEVTDKLISNDIMTPLLTAFKQSLEFLQKGQEVEEAFSNVSQIIFVISFLCENSEVGTDIVSNYDNIIEMFFSLIFHQKIEQDLLVATFQCLLVISDENEKFSKKFQKFPNSFDLLGKVFTNEKTPNFCKSLISGILLNLTNEKEKMKVISLISPFLFDNLKFNSFESLSSIFQILNSKDKEGVEKTEIEEYKNWKNLSLSQKLSIELFSDMNSYIEGDTNEKIVLIQNLLELSKTINENLEKNQVLNSLPLIKDDLNLIFSILQNSIICIESITLSVSNNFFKNFDSNFLLNFVFSLFEKRNDELTENLTGIIWALSGNQIQLTTQQVEIIGKFSFSSNETIRVNALGILGEIGQLNHTKDQNLSLLKIFYSKLSDTSMKVVCQSLNSIFDTYKDSNWNQNLSEFSFIEKMIQFLEKFKNKL